MKHTDMKHNHNDIINTQDFDFVAQKLREFFISKGYAETHTQNRLSILAACEDPFNIRCYNYLGQKWPLPQTGQMWLEYELLQNPGLPGVFCMSTSYREEANPKPGRHNFIFPMFEFESHGGIDELLKLEKELIEFLGFKMSPSFEIDYEHACERYNTDEIHSTQEEAIGEDIGPYIMLKNFPERTNPFWNMKRTGDKANKIDVLLYGMETIGSAERSCDQDEMRNRFLTICDGRYAEKLYEEFSKERVLAELDDFLSLDFFPRFGAGIGFNRLIRAFGCENRLPSQINKTLEKNSQSAAA